MEAPCRLFYSLEVMFPPPTPPALSPLPQPFFPLLLSQPLPACSDLLLPLADALMAAQRHAQAAGIYARVARALPLPLPLALPLPLPLALPPPLPLRDDIVHSQADEPTQSVADEPPEGGEAGRGRQLSGGSSREQQQGEEEEQQQGDGHGERQAISGSELACDESTVEVWVKLGEALCRAGEYQAAVDVLQGGKA